MIKSLTCLTCLSWNVLFESFFTGYSILASVQKLTNQRVFPRPPHLLCILFIFFTNPPHLICFDLGIFSPSPSLLESKLQEGRNSVFCSLGIFQALIEQRTMISPSWIFVLRLNLELGVFRTKMMLIICHEYRSLSCPVTLYYLDCVHR